MFYKRVILGSKNYTKELNTVECTSFRAKLASFGQLGLISESQICSKLQNGINDHKGLENRIYTFMKGREFFTVTPQSQLLAVVKFNMFLKRVVLWKHCMVLLFVHFFFIYNNFRNKNRVLCISFNICQ